MMRYCGMYLRGGMLADMRSRLMRVPQDIVIPAELSSKYAGIAPFRFSKMVSGGTIMHSVEYAVHNFPDNKYVKKLIAANYHLKAKCLDFTADTPLDVLQNAKNTANAYHAGGGFNVTEWAELFFQAMDIFAEYKKGMGVRESNLPNSGL